MSWRSTHAFSVSASTRSRPDDVMPILASEKHKYPLEWPAIRARILARAGNACEFTCEDGTRCSAPDRHRICRGVKNPETWSLERHAVEYLDPETYTDPVLVVLTVAHLNHDPADCRDENLKAGCQLHHLR